jgi:hypothetical protein
MEHHVPMSHILPDQTTSTFDSGAVSWSKQVGLDLDTMRRDCIPEADVQISDRPALRPEPLRRVEVVGRSGRTPLVSVVAIVERG